jgi:hypothetical protein
MLFYKATINKRRDGDEKLLIDPRDIVRKLGEVTTLLEELSGQETLFTRSTTWADPKPKGKARTTGSSISRRRAREARRG